MVFLFSWFYIYLLLWSADVIQQSPKANIDAAFKMCWKKTWPLMAYTVLSFSLALSVAILWPFTNQHLRNATAHTHTLCCVRLIPNVYNKDKTPLLAVTEAPPWFPDESHVLLEDWNIQWVDCQPDSPGLKFKITPSRSFCNLHFKTDVKHTTQLPNLSLLTRNKVQRVLNPIS